MMYAAHASDHVRKDAPMKDLARTAVAALAIAAVGLGAIDPVRSESQLAVVPIPAPVAAKEGWAQLADTKLFYWDTGGDGLPIVLLHPATGSALIWGYQQPVFAMAGYRVIAYSRRGYYNSAPFERDRPGIGSEDLRQLADVLGIRRFHVVASAAGGSIAADFALSYPDRLLSLTNSSNSFGLRDGAIARAQASIRPKIWNDIPPDVRELGPSYRALNPDGVKQWIELEHKALVGGEARQMLKNEMTEAKLAQLKVPTLLIAGAADLITPPSISRMIAAKIPGSELVVAPEAGHSVYWEQPDLFNRAVLDFIGKHAK
jgi:pimeloyl-ACP methyl ester carboxylesterase